MATYKGKACTIVKRNNGKKKKTVTVRFNTTGSEMTVSASRIATGRVNAKKKNPKKRRKAVRRAAPKRRKARRNPNLAFGRHQGRAKKVTFFVHSTRASKPYNRGAKVPSGYSVIGRPVASRYPSKAAYSAAQKAKWAKMSKAARKKATAHLRRR